jgi:hypothetical protein
MPKKPKQPPPPPPPELASVWHPVLEIATGLRDLRPWQFFAPDAVFGVNNPDTGETDWCIVMGQNGETFGIAMYPGDAGYQTLHRTLQQEIDPFDHQIAQRCTTLYFESSADLLPTTKKLLKSLGRSFRGANAWPELLVHEPGLVPVPPWNTSQMNRIAEVLGGVASLIPWAAEDPHAGSCQVANHAWVTAAPFGEQDRRLQALPKVGPGPAPAPAPFDRLAAARLRNSDGRRAGQWFAEWFAGMSIVDDKEVDGRPYFAVHMFLLDIESSMLVGVHVSRLETVAADLQALVLKTAAQLGRPVALHVRRPDLAQTMQPFAEELGVPLACEPRLAAVTEQIRNEMQQFLGH